MSDTEATTDQTPQPDPDEPKGLRKQVADLSAKLKKYQQRDMKEGLEAIGLTPDKELGLAIVENYEGEYEAEAIAEFARDRYGYTPAPTAENPQAEKIAQGQAALDNVGQEAGSVPLAPSETDRLSQAEAEKDYGTTLRMKSDQVAGWFGGPNNS